MDANPKDINTFLNILENTPFQIEKAIIGLTETQIQTPPEPDGWSINQILIHLCACGDVWRRDIDRMYNEEHPTFRYVSPRSVMRQKKYQDEAFQNTLSAFQLQRQDLLIFLTSLDDDGWVRGATVKASSRLKEDTIFTYIRRMALHEAPHIEQMEAIASGWNSSDS